MQHNDTELVLSENDDAFTLLVTKYQKQTRALVQRIDGKLAGVTVFVRRDFVTFAEKMFQLVTSSRDRSRNNREKSFFY